MLFTDFSSTFIPTIPQQLTGKSRDLGFNNSFCNWILDFLSQRPQSVYIDRITSRILAINTGCKHLLRAVCSACSSSPCWLTNVRHSTTLIASTTSLMIQQLWASHMDKMKQMIVDFRKVHAVHSPLHIEDSAVEIVRSTRFFDVPLTDITWALTTTSLAKKAQQHLHFLPPILTLFYKQTTECPDQLSIYLEWELQSDSEYSGKNHWDFSPLRSRHFS